MAKAKVISIASDKGGNGKTATAVSLVAGLTLQNKKALLLGLDPSANATTALGWRDKDSFQITVATHLERVLDEETGNPLEGVLQHFECFDVLPANRKLSKIERALDGTDYGRESVLKSYVDTLREYYDYIVIDCPGCLSILTINALVASDSVILPTQTQLLSADSLSDTIALVKGLRKQLNPSLLISGILLTMVNKRTTISRMITESIRQQYGGTVKIYNAQIPYGIAAQEAPAAGISILTYSEKSLVAKAYSGFVDEVLADEEGN